MNKTNNCPSNSELAEFFDGRLEGSTLVQIAEHLESCSWCQGTLRTLTSTDTLVESLRGGSTAIEHTANRLPESLLSKLQQIPMSESGLGYSNSNSDLKSHPFPDESSSIVLPVVHPSRD
jgi:hypothetical protein